MRPAGQEWGTMTFASTLYLGPILDLLLAEVPASWQMELRLGLQEALVNAAKHGNKLDPRKRITVRFSMIDSQYWWVISDEGGGFNPQFCLNDLLPEDESECGRGVCLLYTIFDQVQWSADGRELRLSKSLKKSLPGWLANFL